MVCWARRMFKGAAVLSYCVALFFIFDFTYSAIQSGDPREFRVADPQYHHGLRPNFDGYEIWGSQHYRLRTNSLGFKDGAVRDVPMTSASRRILLIGDSFTEGLGMPFEDTFAGMLYHAGQERPEKTEFLNAAVSSYSPSIYYSKIKYLLERGLHVDEVVVFSDPSDVQDEATAYFCIDEDPEYQSYCKPEDAASRAPGEKPFFRYHFQVMSTISLIIYEKFQLFINHRRSEKFDVDRVGWLFPYPGVAEDNKPLGVKGGIERSLHNMQALATLLSKRGIPLTIVVYPWPVQLAEGKANNEQVSLWREFCVNKCKAFIDLFPTVMAEMKADKDWYQHLFIPGDIHYSAAGNALMFRELQKRLF
jgi:hypothetical protein